MSNNYMQSYVAGTPLSDLANPRNMSGGALKRLPPSELAPQGEGWRSSTLGWGMILYDA